MPPSTTLSAQHMNATSSASNANKIISTTNNDDKYCFTKGSLHQLAIDTFYHFSPPNSTSYNKLKHVLDTNPAFYINMGGGRGIFAKNEEMISRMLRGYGLKQVPRPSYTSSNQTRVLFAVTIFTLRVQSVVPNIVAIIHESCFRRNNTSNQKWGSVTSLPIAL